MRRDGQDASRAARRRRARSPYRALVTPALALGALVAGVVFLARVDEGRVAWLPGPTPARVELDESPSWQPRFSELNKRDREILRQQREAVNELARRHVGRELSGRSLRDLELLQKLLDREVLSADQTWELQSLGVALGDVLAARHGLVWVVYTDDLGRSRAVRLPDSDFVLFPVTMISKRIERDVAFTVDELYRKSARQVEEARATGGRGGGARAGA